MTTANAVTDSQGHRLSAVSNLNMEDVATRRTDPWKFQPKEMKEGKVTQLDSSTKYSLIYRYLRELGVRVTEQCSFGTVQNSNIRVVKVRNFEVRSDNYKIFKQTN